MAAFMRRTHNCGELRKTHAGQTVTLNGWVAARHDHGKIIFINLRDREGITQLYFNPDLNAEAFAVAQTLRNEFVIAAKGVVRARGQENVKGENPTREIEIEITNVEVLNTCEPLPFPVMEQGKETAAATEETRLQYRYLDLRRPAMRENIKLRHLITKAIRDYMTAEGYWEIETPILYKSTPEGAREFLVPSRRYNGSFYALPQSPQLFKQILQSGGIEKYFQIARCFRDEAGRGDRQPEFTQLDIEASFIEEEDIYRLMEGLVAKVCQEAKGMSVKLPLPRMKYSEAMRRFGKDKPDTRFGLELIELTDLVKAGCDFKVFTEAVANKGIVRGITVEGAAEKFSRKQITELETKLKSQYPNVKGLAWFKMEKGKPTGGSGKFFEAATGKPFIERLGAKDGAICFFLADAEEIVCEGLGTLRLWLGEELGLIPANQWNFLWVVDFPMFEYDEEEKRLKARHHPFTSPKPEHLEWVESRPTEVLARAYDLVLNGVEIAGGSIRMHRLDVQRRLFRALGISDEQAQSRFSHLLQALAYGTPPHGGIALGLDRFIMLLAGAKTIREVIAFPKTLAFKCMLTGAPDEVTTKQLDELGIMVKPGVAEKKP